MLPSLRARAAAARGDDCYFVLRDFVAWFEDPHLFVFQSTRLDTAETARRARVVEVREIDEARVRQHLLRDRARLDPIEGVWYDGPLRVAVLRDGAAGSREFVAVVLTSDTSTWRPGSVRARFTRRDDGSYDARVWSRNHALRYLDARIHRRVVLRLSPGMWGRELPIIAGESEGLDRADVHRPTLRVRGRTAIVSVPSHDPAYRPVLDSLVAAHAAALRDAERLIVDLRGNEGGASFTTNALLPYIVSERDRPGVRDGDERTVMLSNDDQIAYARRGFGPDTSRFVRSLIARLEASPGAFVPFVDPTERQARTRIEPIVGPRRVAVIVDRGTVSAAEVLVLHALRSERATVFGEPTAGALDYPSVNVVPFAPDQRRWFLGYPTLAASTSLPEGGMRGRGIVPDVVLDLARIADVVSEVERRSR
jgi:hypothetical protein